MTLLSFAPVMTRADFRLPTIFSDNMVLQQDKDIPIWGWADAGDDVTVAIADQSQRATSDADGRWHVKLQPFSRGAQPLEMTVATPKKTIVINNILVGEVWLCSGQSNMVMGMPGVENAAAEMAAANYPQLRQFIVETADGTPEPKDDVPGRWLVCDPKDVARFSGVAYYFGRDVHETLKVPVGLINSARNGSCVEAWMTRAALEALPEAKPILDRYAAALPDFPEKNNAYKKAMAEYEQGMRTAKTDDEKRKLVYPMAPFGPGRWDAPANLYNSMIAPLVPYAIRGAIWYQGESNADRAYQYRALFPAMIRDWRKTFGQGDFAFYFVQVANYQARLDVPSEHDWAELREAQATALKLRSTGMACAIDVGEAANVHPRNKKAVGQRLARIALSQTYSKGGEFSGPMLDLVKIDGDKVRLTFKHVGSGLTTPDNEPLKGFAVAGEDRKFVWADAKIDSDAVIVSSSQIAKPVAVRYAWAANPDCNLCNKEGLPAPSFRTDDWPGVTNDHR
jgi:sialate O-acetylesterase